MDFREFHTGEVRRTPLPHTRVNKRFDLKGMNPFRCQTIQVVTLPEGDGKEEQWMDGGLDARQL